MNPFFVLFRSPGAGPKRPEKKGPGEPDPKEEEERPKECPFELIWIYLDKIQYNEDFAA